ncbi:helix-turn-helix domain-containing protein [Streptomyces sp. NPDC016626]|uniref:helix-turn-helix domain-containing protein n=1 Tax=Streptomyces sp. NPDC016626 TaxID=3364968 RepID=UPI0036F7E610
MDSKPSESSYELRLQAAERFAQGDASAVIAKDLRVSVRSVQRWRHVWEGAVHVLWARRGRRRCRG